MNVNQEHQVRDWSKTLGVSPRAEEGGLPPAEIASRRCAST
ncbi:DUF3606 domain-containing protein [Ramlibacter henchirensis]|nr:DUF3606 domain-containing protein [Ramlibacter henchirensis]